MLLFRECGGPPDQGRTDPTSLHSALVVVLIKEKIVITVTSETRECAKRSVSAILNQSNIINIRLEMAETPDVGEIGQAVSPGSKRGYQTLIGSRHICGLWPGCGAA